MNFAGFHAGYAENDTITRQHNEEGWEDAPGDPEGRVARLSVPRRHARPLEAVELKGGPAEQRRQAAYQRVKPHVGDDDNRPVACDLHGVDHRVEHGIVPVVRRHEHDEEICTTGTQHRPPGRLLIRVTHRLLRLESVIQKLKAALFSLPDNPVKCFPKSCKQKRTDGLGRRTKTGSVI